MATFTHIPGSFVSTLADGAVYGFELEEPATVDLRITDAESGTLLSARRFVDTSGAEVDIAPVIRRTAKAAPQAGATSLHPIDGRQVMVNIALYGATDGALLATAPTRAFLVSTSPLLTPGLYTTMPLSRTMSPAECDCLLLHLNAGETVTITATRGRERSTTTLTSPVAGVQELRIAAADFPDAEQLEVAAANFCRVRYTLLAVPTDSVRLAWRTECGSIEHYTFPIVVKKSLKVERTALRNGSSLINADDTTRSRHIVSAFEAPAVAEALGEIISSPEVWEVTAQGYRKVEVLTEKCSTEQRGLYSTVELTIGEPEKTSVSWS